MAYRKKYVKKNKVKTGKQMVRAKDVPAIVRKTISAEAETYNSFATTSQQCTWNSGVLDLSDSIAPQGTSDQSRLGDELNLTSMQLKGQLSWTSSTSALSPVRLMILQLKADADTTLAFTSIFVQTAQGFTTMTQINPDIKPLFRVLHDKVYTPPSSGGRTCTKLCNILVRPRKINYNGGSATLTIDGKLCMYFFSNNGASTPDTPTYTAAIQYSWKGP